MEDKKKSRWAKKLFFFKGRPDGKRMCKSEQDEMIRLFGAINLLIDCDEHDCFRRIEGTYNRRFMRTAITLLIRVMNDLIDTMPEEQAGHMARQLKNTHFLSYTGKYSNVRTYGDQGRWMSFDELNMCAVACRECCRNCMITDTIEQKKCAVKKFLDLMPIDCNADAHGCPWFAEMGAL